jgi:DNA-binding beta-propeller fold protein YncE
MVLRVFAIIALAAFTAMPSWAESLRNYVPKSPYDWMVVSNLEKLAGWFIVYFLPDDPTDPKAKADPATGAPIALPGTLPVGCPASKTAAIHPNGRFIYLATDAGSFGNVCAFAFDPVAQTLTPVPGSPFRAGIGTSSIALDPSGTFAYATNLDDGTVSAFGVDAVTGSLTSVTGSPFAAGTYPISVVVESTGRYVYVANNSPEAATGTISGFAINAATGGLTPLPGSPYAAPRGPWALAADPRGKYLYLAARRNQAYAINPGNGALTPVGGDFGPPGQGVAVDPSGRFVYITSGGGPLSSLLTPYVIIASGALSAAGPGQATGDNPLGVAVSRNGRHVYTANLGSNDLSGFDIDNTTGALTPIAGSPFAAGQSPYGVATAGGMRASEQWNAGVPYFRTFGVGGGLPPYTWAITDGALPAGITLAADLGAVTGTPAAAGTYTFTASVTDAAGARAAQAYSLTVQGVSLPAFATVVEYYNTSLDHYFITWRDDEIAKLDAGTVIKGWTRTGKTFNVFVSTQAGSSPICRYYIPPARGDSHFFGRGTTECAATGQKNPTFVLEDPAFMHMLLPAAGVCPASTQPIYRVFSNRPDANHRYMTDRALRDQMVAQGWLAEGDGPDLVVMCAPA